MDILAPLFSAVIFLAGSATGVVGIAATAGAVAAKAGKAAAEAAARAARIAARNSKAPKGSEEAKKLADQSAKMNAMAAAAAKRESASDTTVKTSGALGAGLWTTASAFTLVGAFVDPEGKLEESDLSPQLDKMWTAALKQLEILGNRALGRGGGYEGLPMANGTGHSSVILSSESYVAGFFSDGKMLLAESNEDYVASITATYSTFRSKVVDIALQTAGWQVFALMEIESEESCKSDTDGGYGAQWMEFPWIKADYRQAKSWFCVQLFQKAPSPEPCGQLKTCDWMVRTEGIKKLETEYGFNLRNYYTAAIECNVAQLTDSMPDFAAMQLDGVTPACFYNIRAQVASKFSTCNGAASCQSGLHQRLGYNARDFRKIGDLSKNACINVNKQPVVDGVCNS